VLHNSHQQIKATTLYCYFLSRRAFLSLSRLITVEKKNKLKTSRKRKNIFAPGRKVYRTGGTRRVEEDSLGRYWGAYQHTLQSFR